METEKVLLVDDEVEFAAALAERLRTRGLEVEIANSGEEAVRKAKARPPDAVVLDLAMPGMDGLETLKALLAANAELQVMLLTGQATIKTALAAARLGAVDVLEKPTDITTLLEKIREARARRLVLKQQRSDSEIERILRARGW
jgi:DNA-binding NtrC family response regulator